MKQYLVSYKYDGGRGSELVTAPSETAATELAMSQAKPNWSPGAPVQHTDTVRCYDYHEMVRAPRRGVNVVVVLGWKFQDKGDEFLVTERGSFKRDLQSYWYENAALVASEKTRDSAEKKARLLGAKARERGISAEYDVVLRGEVEIRHSSQAYGCIGAT